MSFDGPAALLLTSASNLRPADLSLPIVIVPPRFKEVMRNRKETLTTGFGCAEFKRSPPIFPRGFEKLTWDFARRHDAQPEGKRILKDHPATRQEKTLIDLIRRSNRKSHSCLGLFKRINFILKPTKSRVI
jgi:hypothetical protein